MYGILLALHSLTRWLVLSSLLLAIFCAYRGWLLGKPFLRLDEVLSLIAVTTAHIQFVLGILLYFVSPIVAYFFHHFSTAVHQRVIRFFGMEHITMMVIGIAVITIGAAKAKNKTTDREKFKTTAIWFTVALLIILSSIPWSFSPLISRPNFRFTGPIVSGAHGLNPQLL
ncbi:MAG: hypothetical protein V4456_17225 [Bacteroidota bacterium]